MVVLKFNFKHVLCRILLVFVSSVNLVKAQSSCNTPRGDRGVCIPYGECGLLSSQLERYGNFIPQSFALEIRRRHCEPFRQEIYICCELQYSSTLRKSTTTATRSTTIDASISTSNPGSNQAGLNILGSMKCGVSGDNRVSFGEAASLGQFPWMALLRYDSPEEFQCAGTLITERYVLTAAHCIIGQRYNVIGVRLGEHDISTAEDCQLFGALKKCSPPPEDFGIEKIITHEGYKGIKNDIALIRLDRNVECKRYIQPICLPITSKSKVLQQEQEYFIAGWGYTEKNIRSNVLLHATIPHLPIETCHSVYKNYASDITDFHLCAGGRKRQDSCKGDSGGPLFFISPFDKRPRFVQYGVVSFGVPACGPQKSYPTLFTRVEVFLPWITNKLAENAHVPSTSCTRS